MTPKLKMATLSGLRKFGYDLTRRPTTGSSEHESVNPLATYSPWNTSPEFLACYEVIRHNTLVDLYRCWELWSLVQQAAKLDGGIIEIGVWRGGTGALMAKSAQRAGISDSIYLCDTFAGVVKAGPSDTQYRGGEHADTSARIVEDLLQRLGLSNVLILDGIFPDQTGHLIAPDVRFRLCHIDVDVYQSAKDVMAWVWDRVVPGGIVVYDDYGFQGCEGVTKYVNEQTGERDRLVLHNLNGHAIVIKTPLG